MNSSKKSLRMCEELLLSLTMGTYTENDLKNILSIANNKMINMNYSMRQYFIKHIYSYCKSKTNYDKIFLKHKKLSIDEKILAFNTFQDPKDYFISFIEKDQFDFQADSFVVSKHSDGQKNDYKENEEYRLYQIKAFLSSFSQFTKLFPNKIMEEKTTVFRILCNLLYMNIFDHQLRQEMIMLLFDKQDFIEPKVFKDLLSITLKLIYKRLKKTSKIKEEYFDIIRYEMLLTVLSNDLFKIVYDKVEGKHKESKEFLLKETEKIVKIKQFYDELIDNNDPISKNVYKIDKYLINLPFKYIYKFILDNKDKFIENNDNTEDTKLLQYLGKIVSPQILVDIYNKNKNFIKSWSSNNKLLIKVKVLSYIESKKKRLSKFQNIEFDFQRMLISMLYINKHLRNIILQQEKLTKELFYEIDKNKQILNNLNKIQFNKCKDLIYIHDKCIPKSQDNSKFEQFKDKPLLVIEVEKKEPFVFQDKIELAKPKNKTITYFMVGAYIGNRDLNHIGEFFVYNHYNSTFFQVGKNYNNIHIDLEKYINQLSKEKKLDKSIYFLFTPVSKEREKYKLISKSDYE